MDARFGQRDLLREAFARVHVRVVRALELLLERVDLLLREGGSVALEFPLQPQPRLCLFVVLQTISARSQTVRRRVFFVFVLAVSFVRTRIQFFFFNIAHHIDLTVLMTKHIRRGRRTRRATRIAHKRSSGDGSGRSSRHIPSRRVMSRPRLAAIKHAKLIVHIAIVSVRTISALSH